VLAPQDLNPGDTVQSGASAPIKPGNVLPLKDIPVGMPINSIELHPNKGGQLCRAAGCMATIVNKQQEHAIVRLPSGGCGDCCHMCQWRHRRTRALLQTASGPLHAAGCLCYQD
jgi:ribosomal protein L2